MIKLWTKCTSLMIVGMLFFTSCESNQRDESSTSNEEIAAESEEVDDSDDYFVRRKIAEDNIDYQISKLKDEIESLKNETVQSIDDKSQIDQRIVVLEERIDFLKDQKKILKNQNNDQSVLESVEANLQEVLEEEVEMQEKDRTRHVRGEGTSLDGPAINNSGTRTGTEVERRQKSIVERIDQSDTTDEDQK